MLFLDKFKPLRKLLLQLLDFFLDSLHFTSHPAFSTSKEVISRIARFSLEKGIVLFDLTIKFSLIDFLIFD